MAEEDNKPKPNKYRTPIDNSKYFTKEHTDLFKQSVEDYQIENLSKLSKGISVNSLVDLTQTPEQIKAMTPEQRKLFEKTVKTTLGGINAADEINLSHFTINAPTLDELPVRAKVYGEDTFNPNATIKGLVDMGVKPEIASKLNMDQANEVKKRLSNSLADFVPVNEVPFGNTGANITNDMTIPVTAPAFTQGKEILPPQSEVDKVVQETFDKKALMELDKQQQTDLLDNYRGSGVLGSRYADVIADFFGRAVTNGAGFYNGKDVIDLLEKPVNMLDHIITKNARVPIENRDIYKYDLPAGMQERYMNGGEKILAILAEFLPDVYVGLGLAGKITQPLSEAITNSKTLAQALGYVEKGFGTKVAEYVGSKLPEIISTVNTFELPTITRGLTGILAGNETVGQFGKDVLQQGVMGVAFGSNPFKNFKDIEIFKKYSKQLGTTFMDAVEKDPTWKEGFIKTVNDAQRGGMEGKEVEKLVATEIRNFIKNGDGTAIGQSIPDLWKKAFDKNRLAEITYTALVPALTSQLTGMALNGTEFNLEEFAKSSVINTAFSLMHTQRRPDLDPLRTMRENARMKGLEGKEESSGTGRSSEEQKLLDVNAQGRTVEQEKTLDDLLEQADRFQNDAGVKVEKDHSGDEVIVPSKTGEEVKGEKVTEDSYQAALEEIKKKLVDSKTDEALQTDKNKGQEDGQMQAERQGDKEVKPSLDKGTEVEIKSPLGEGETSSVIPTFKDAEKMHKQELKQGGITSLPAGNVYAAKELGGSLGLNEKYLYEEATKKGIDLQKEMLSFDGLTDKDERTQFGVDLMDRLSKNADQEILPQSTQRENGTEITEGNLGKEQKDLTLEKGNSDVKRDDTKSELDLLTGTKGEDVSPSLKPKGKKQTKVVTANTKDEKDKAAADLEALLSVKSDELKVKSEEQKQDGFPVKTSGNDKVGEVQKPIPPVKTSGRYKVVETPVKDVNTAVDKFQNRDEEFSQDSVNGIVSAIKDGSFNFDKFDPVRLWVDPKDNKTYVLAGHSRLKAFETVTKEGIKGYDTVPSIVMEGLTEQQARDYAKKESNTLGTAESLTARAKIYRDMRGSKTEAEILKDAKKNEKKNAMDVYYLSFLKPKGSMIQAYKLMDSGSAEVKARTQKMASAIGRARKEFENLTDQHEEEIYTWLNKKKDFGYDDLRTKLKFLEEGSWDFDYGKPLNLENKAESVQEADFRREVAKVRSDLKAAEKDLEDTRETLALRQAKDPTITDKEVDTALEKRRAVIRGLQKDLVDITGKLDKYLDAAKDQEALFSKKAKWQGKIETEDELRRKENFFKALRKDKKYTYPEKSLLKMYLNYNSVMPLVKQMGKDNPLMINGFPVHFNNSFLDVVHFFTQGEKERIIADHKVQMINTGTFEDTLREGEVFIAPNNAGKQQLYIAHIHNNKKGKPVTAVIVVNQKTGTIITITDNYSKNWIEKTKANALKTFAFEGVRLFPTLRKVQLQRNTDNLLNHNTKINKEDTNVKGNNLLDKEKTLKEIEKFETDLKDAKEKDEIAGLLGQEDRMEMFSKTGEWGKVADPFYSHLERTAAAKIQNNATPEQIKKTLFNAGVKQAEYDDMRMDVFLEGKDKVSKADLMDFIEANKLQLSEVVKDSEDGLNASQQSRYDQLVEGYHIGELTPKEIKEMQDLAELRDRDNTKYSQWKLEGGTKYRERLFTLPETPIRKPYEKWLTENFTGEDSEYARQLYSIQVDPSSFQFKDSHWKEMNVVMFERDQEMTTTDGEKVLHSDEIQSGIHQAGRKKGYISAKEKADLEKVDKDWEKVENKLIEYQTKVHFADGLKIRQYKGDWAIFNTQQIGEDSLLVTGFKSKEEAEKYFDERYKLTPAEELKLTELQIKDQEYAEKNLKINRGGLPDFPLKKNWHEVVFKRMLRVAAESGYKRITWNKGKTQADRYKLSQAVKDIRWKRAGEETNVQIRTKSDSLYIIAVAPDGKILDKKSTHIPSEWNGKNLEDVIGKDMAKKILMDDSLLKRREITSSVVKKPAVFLSGEGYLWDLTVNGNDIGSFESEKDARDREKFFLDQNVTDAEGKLEGEGLNVGGQGMTGFYDKMIVDYANKLGKKYGVNAGETEVKGQQNYEMISQAQAIKLWNDGGTAIYESREDDEDPEFNGYYQVDDADTFDEMINGNNPFYINKGEKNTPVNTIELTPEWINDLMYTGQAMYSQAGTWENANPLIEKLPDIVEKYAQLGYTKIENIADQLRARGMSDLLPHLAGAYREFLNRDLSVAIKNEVSNEEEISNWQEDSINGGLVEGTNIEDTGNKVQTGSTINTADRGVSNGIRPALRYFDEGNIPTPKEHISLDRFTGTDGKPAINEHQRFAINLAIDRFNSGGKVFLLGDGTGVGKTREILGLAKYWQDKTHKPILIIAPDKRVVSLSFKPQAKAMRIALSQMEVGTYEDLRLAKVGAEEYGLVIFDESQNLKNEEAFKTIAANKIKTDHIMYTSATPMDNPKAAIYFLNEISGLPLAEIMRRIGIKYEINEETKKKELVVEEWRTEADVIKAIIELRNQAIGSGAMIRREYPFWGQIHEKYITPPANSDFADMQAQIVEYYRKKIKGILNSPHKFRVTIAKAYGSARSGELMALSESLKAQSIFEAGLEELQKNRKPIIIGKFIEPRLLKSINVTVNGFFGDLAKKFDAAGIPFSKVYGGDLKQNLIDVDEFQADKRDVLLMTPESGGQGIDLDDQRGTKARSVLVANSGFGGDTFQQAVLGRPSRMNTKSSTDVYLFYYEDSISDLRRQEILSGKIRISRALQEGIDVDNLMDIGDNRGEVVIRRSTGRNSGEQRLFSKRAGWNDPEIKSARKEVGLDKDLKPELMAIHNLTPENLLFAVKMGGLAMPSIAITKAKQGFEKYGSVSLIGDKRMVDPEEGVSVFNRDVYSPTYPTVYRYVDSKKLYDIVDMIRKSFPEGLMKDIADSGMIDDLERGNGYASDVQHNDLLRAYYLKEKGQLPAYPMREERLHFLPKTDTQWDIAQKLFKKYPMLAEGKIPANDEKVMEEETQKMLKDENAYSHLSSDPARREEIIRERAKDMEKGRQRKVYDAEAYKFYKDYIKEVNNWYKSIKARDMKYPVDKYVNEYELSNDIARLREHKQVLDKWKLNEEMDKLIKPQQKEYNDFLEKLFDPIFGRQYVKQGNKKISHTMDNVIDVMGKKIKGAEKTMFKGLSYSATQSAKKFTSIQDMRNSAGKIVPQDEFEMQRKELTAWWNNLLDKIGSYYKWQRGFDSLDELSMALGQVAKKVRPSDSYVQSVLYRHDYVNVPEYLYDDVRNIAKIIREMPTEYFEAKKSWAVPIKGFKAAVVPIDVQTEVVNALNDAGLTIGYYNPAIPEDRQYVTEQLMENENLLFSKKSDWGGDKPFTGSFGMGIGNPYDTLRALAEHREKMMKRYLETHEYRYRNEIYAIDDRTAEIEKAIERNKEKNKGIAERESQMEGLFEDSSSGSEEQGQINKLIEEGKDLNGLTERGDPEQLALFSKTAGDIAGYEVDLMRKSLGRINDLQLESRGRVPEEDTSTAAALQDNGGDVLPSSKITDRGAETQRLVAFNEKYLARTEKLIKDGHIKFEGLVIKTPEDLAFACQVLRDPRFETLRFFYLDKDGKELGSRSYTSRFAGVVGLPSAEAMTDAIRRDMSNLGASRVIMMHNHPIGDPIQTGSDLHTTQNLMRLVPELEYGMAINHGKYSVTRRDILDKDVDLDGADGDDAQKFHKLYDLKLGEDFLLGFNDPTGLLGKVISPQQLPKLAKAMQMDTDMMVVTGVDPNFRVTSMQEVPIGMADDYMGLQEFLRDQTVKTGSVSFIITTGDKTELNSKQFTNIKTLVENNRLLDFIDNSGTYFNDVSMRSKSGQPYTQEYIADRTNFGERIKSETYWGLVKEKNEYLRELKQRVMSAVEVWHGSPHDITKSATGKFSLKHIGTGEGVAAFGWGLYFTDLKGVAEHYAENNEATILRAKLKDTKEQLLDDEEHLKYYEKTLKKLSTAKMYDPAKKSRIDMLNKNIELYKDTISILQARAEKYEKELEITGRHLYKVKPFGEKDAADLNWLEWDLPATDKQIEQIREQAEKEGILDQHFYKALYDIKKLKETPLVLFRYSPLINRTPAFNVAVESKGNPVKAKDMVLDLLKNADYDMSTVNMEDINLITDHFINGMELKNHTGQVVYNTLEHLLSAGQTGDKAQRVSEFLLRAGIDGNRYPAETLAAGKTRETARGFNYVVFDDKNIEIADHQMYSKAGKWNFAPAPAETTPAFKKYFEGSKAVNPDGSPMRLAHFTKGNFDTFKKGDIGYHVGTIEQAHNRGKDFNDTGVRGNTFSDGGNIMLLYGAFKNPLEMQDVGQWNDPQTVLDALRNMPAISKLINDHNFANGDNISLADITNFLEKIGYDSIKYINKFETNYRNNLIKAERNLATKIQKIKDKNKEEANAEYRKLLKEKGFRFTIEKEKTGVGRGMFRVMDNWGVTEAGGDMVGWGQKEDKSVGIFSSMAAATEDAGEKNRRDQLRYRNFEYTNPEIEDLRAKFKKTMKRGNSYATSKAGDYSWIAFRGAQLKSVYGNNGNFASGDHNVLHSKAGDWAKNSGSKDQELSHRGHREELTQSAQSKRFLGKEQNINSKAGQWLLPEQSQDKFFERNKEPFVHIGMFYVLQNPEISAGEFGIKLQQEFEKQQIPFKLSGRMIDELYTLAAERYAKKKERDAEAKVNKLEKRKFTKHFKESDEQSERVKAEIESDWYKKIGNKETSDKAVKLLDEDGIDGTINRIMNNDPEILGEVKVAATILIALRNKQEEDLLIAEGKLLQAQKIANKTADLVDYVSENLGTLTGRTIQAFSLLNKITAGGWIRKLKKALQPATEGEKENIEQTTDNITQQFNDLNAAEIEALISGLESEKKDLIRQLVAAQMELEGAQQGITEEEKQLMFAEYNAQIENLHKLFNDLKAQKSMQEEGMKKQIAEYEKQLQQSEWLMKELQARIKDYEDKDKTITIINTVQGTIKDLTDRIVDGINKGESPEGTKQAAKVLKNAAERMTGAADRLAKKVINSLKPPKKAELPDEVALMVKTLWEIAKENKLVPEQQPMTKTKLIEIVGRAVNRDGEYTDVWDKAKEIVGKKLKDEPAAMQKLDDYFLHYLENPFSEKEISSVVKTGIKELEINLTDVVRQHYTVVDESKRTLLDKLIQESGVEGEAREEAIKKFIAALDKKWEELTEEKRVKILENQFKISTKKAKELYKKIVEWSNLGAFSRDQFRPLVAEKLGVKIITPDMIKQIKELADKIQTLPEDSVQQSNAIKNMLDYIAVQKGVKITDQLWGLWYSSILSGVSTQIKNFTENSMLKINGITNRNPREIPAAILGLINGMKVGFPEFKATMGGLTPRHLTRGKYEQSGVLELMDFGGGNFNPLNWAKYVGRLLKAVDVMDYYQLQEMQAYSIAYQQARRTVAVADAGKSKGQMMRDEMNRILNAGHLAEAEAREQAKKEGLTGTEYTRRVNQILEEKRANDLKAETERYGLFNTFNNRPIGVVGALARAIQSFQKNKAGKWSKVIVPFTNIVANVFNMQLNFTPVGVFRGMYGYYHGFDNGKGGYEKLNDREKWEYTMNGIKGTLMFMLLGLLMFTDGEDGKPLLEITANGMSDAKKRKQLQETGWKPYSIRLFGRYLPYEYLAPLMIPMIALGIIQDNIRYKKDNDGIDFLSRMETTILLTISSVMDKAFMSGIADMFRALDPNRESTTEKYISDLALKSASAVMPNLVKQLKYVWDANSYEANTFTEKFIRNVGVGQGVLGLKPQQNILGDPITQDWNRIFVYSGSKEKDDPVWRFIADNGTWITTPDKDMLVWDKNLKADRKMTPEEYYDYVKISGKEIKAVMERNMSKLNTLTQDEKRQAVRDIVKTARDNASLIMEGNKSKVAEYSLDVVDKAADNLQKKIKQNIRNDQPERNVLVKTELEKKLASGNLSPEETKDTQRILKYWDRYNTMQTTLYKIDGAINKAGLTKSDGLPYTYMLTDTEKENYVVDWKRVGQRFSSENQYMDAKGKLHDSMRGAIMRAYGKKEITKEEAQAQIKLIEKARSEILKAKNGQ
ncbi:MAG: JAB domain-containing protein [Bacteroidota bacterium]